MDLRTALTFAGFALAFMTVIGITAMCSPIARSEIADAAREAATVTLWAELAALALFFVMVGVWALIIRGFI